MPKKESKEILVSRDERWDRIVKNSETMNIIYRHIANGGSLIDLAETWDVLYCDVALYIEQAPERKKLLKAAYDARNEWSQQAVIREFKRLALVDQRKIFRADGTMLPIVDWPDDIAAALAGFDVQEMIVKAGEDGLSEQTVMSTVIKKIKLADKLKALEMYGKAMGMFTQKVELSGKLTYEQFMAETYDNNEGK